MCRFSPVRRISAASSILVMGNWIRRWSSRWLLIRISGPCPRRSSYSSTRIVWWFPVWPTWGWGWAIRRNLNWSHWHPAITPTTPPPRNTKITTNWLPSPSTITSTRIRIIRIPMSKNMINLGQFPSPIITVLLTPSTLPVWDTREPTVPSKNKYKTRTMSKSLPSTLVWWCLRIGGIVRVKD